MSPLATWPISCANTARVSSRLKRCKRPELTATRASLRFQPVAKAFELAELKIPTSGMPMPAFWASSDTVSSSHFSSALRAWVIICVPVLRLAIHLDRKSEIKEPAIPNTAQNTSSACRFRSTPLACIIELKPSKFRVTLATSKIAMLVIKNRAMRIIGNRSP